MNLENILRRIGCSDKSKNAVITSVTENISEVKKGSIFAAVTGNHTDGNMLIEEAFLKGAAAVITEKDISRDGVYRVADVRKALGEVCSEFYGNPQNKLTVTGITGTNGKTTTAEYLNHILTFSGVSSAVIGTLGSKRGEYINDTGFTTPLQSVLFREMAEHVRAGVTHLVMEVSSQALSQKRTDSVDFELAVLTNIGHDHLDYHRTHEEYVNAKKMLFRNTKKALVNADDVFSEQFTVSDGCELKTYSAMDRLADYSAKNIRFSDDGISYLFLSASGLQRFRMKGTGKITVYNTLCAASAALMLGVSAEVISEAVENLPDVSGRMERLSADGVEIYIDFAHTPEALSAVLSVLSRKPHNNLICVFGCGGDRDKAKRGEMGRIASLYSDTVIVTSDNPRNEVPEDIIGDIISGINNNKNIYTVPDREKAIEKAAETACKGDIVLVAGKGHEEYQLIGSSKKFFSDKLTVRKIFGI